MNKREFGAVRRLPSGRWQAKYRHPRTNQFIAAPNTFALKGDATRWLAGIQREIETRDVDGPRLERGHARGLRHHLAGPADPAAAHGRALRGAAGPLHPARARLG